MDYYPAFFDNRNAGFYNSIVLGEPVSGDVVINAEWGFGTTPADFQKLLDNATAAVAKTKSNKNIKRKSVRNFDIWFGDLSDDEVFVKNNQLAIDKYSMCNIGYVLHGTVCQSHEVRNCGNCL